MTATVVLDLETNGLLDELDRVHCIAMDVDGEMQSLPQPAAPPAVLSTASRLVGHNIQGFDIPALQKVYGFSTDAEVYDTLVAARVIWPDIASIDYEARRRFPDNCIPGQLVGAHSLGAWGHRLGEHKGDYKGGWDNYSQEMLDYCVQDVVVAKKLYEKCVASDTPQAALDLEHRFAAVLDKQMKRGVCFDVQAAEDLCAKLQHRRAEIDDSFQGISFTNVRYTPKKGLRREDVVPFNPGSRDHAARFLRERYGWRPNPEEMTDGGKPKINEKVLSQLPWSEAKLLNERFMLQKRLGMIAEGKHAWLKHVRDGRIYGRIIHNATVTGRCAHSRPNLGQVPAVRAPFGKECRALFRATPGYVLVGADASGLELRCLAHYLAKYDGGRYRDQLREGDIHTVNQEAAGLPTRDNAKTFIYAFLYGAGERKLGQVVGGGVKEGRELTRRFLEKLPALRYLKEAVTEEAKSGRVQAIDGRWIPIRSEHAALNSLLQSAGAIAMKAAVILLDRWLQAEQLDAHQVLMVHDEVQLEASQLDADLVGLAAVRSIQQAGEQLGFNCPLDGEYRIGDTWADTH